MTMLSASISRLPAVFVVAFGLLCCAANAQVGWVQTKAGDLPMTVVYPTDVKEALQKLGPFDISVALDATPSNGNGRLVVLSHGTGCDALTLHGLASTLARASFVVLQPEHKGDNWQDQNDSGPVSWKGRPLEVSQAIDAIAKDPRSKDEAAQRAQAYFKPQPAGAGELLGGSRLRDLRVTAVAVSVPVGAIFTSASLAAIRIPVGIVQADSDRLLPPRFHSSYVLANCSRCESLDTVVGAGHFDVLWPWPDVIAQGSARVPGGARNPAIDDARRRRSDNAVARFFSKNLLP